MLPEPVREKTLRAPHEMMKNVQGSAAGAGSGEFHVYKASRRREYERVKLMEDKGRAVSYPFLQPVRCLVTPAYNNSWKNKKHSKLDKMLEML